jgi:DNA repair exonuclease SbcCD ATPase subunit
MEKVTEECRDASKELFVTLEDLRLDESLNKGMSQRALDALKKAGKAVRKKKDIEKKQEHIHQLNGFLATSMLETLRSTQFSFQEEIRDHISRDTETVLAAVQAAIGTVTQEAERVRKKTTRITESLRFAEMLQRRDDIPRSYEWTYKWIFDPERCPLATWLEHGEGIFWISGKAGSGKSTLMKYLCLNDETRRLCEVWAKEDYRLVIVESYF